MGQIFCHPPQPSSWANLKQQHRTTVMPDKAIPAGSAFHSPLMCLRACGILRRCSKNLDGGACLLSEAGSQQASQ